MNRNTKILNRLSNLIQTQQHTKRIIHHNQMRFIPVMPGWFNIYKSIKMTYHISKMKDKNNDHFNKMQKKHLTKINIKL